MSRIRTKDEFAENVYMLIASDGTVARADDTNQNQEWMADSNNKTARPYSAAKHHRVVGKASGSFLHPSPGSYREVYNGRGSTTDVSYLGDYVINNLSEFLQPPKMEFQKNNRFEVLNFLAEIDDTIAMFSSRFLKSLTRRRIVGNKVKTTGISGGAYGALTWGVVPFISDLVSVRDSLSDIFGGGLQRSLEKSEQSSVVVPVNKEIYEYIAGDPWYIRGSVHGTLRLTGSFYLPDNLSGWDYYNIFLDELGFNPDLKTAWDLIPMSFVADYFLPIGDLLEQIHPRGWFKPVMEYSGRLSAKLNTVSYYSSVYDPTVRVATAKGRYYFRGSMSQSIAPQPGKPLKFNWKAPNMRELFNTAYVALSR